MKRLFLGLMIIVFMGALVGCTKSEYRIAEMEATIKRQGEEIKQLKTKQATQNKEDPVAKALRARWKCCNNTDIEINDEVVRIYFKKVMNLLGFLDGNTENHARLDRNFFLEKTERKTGTIEYYTPRPYSEKVFSISGSLSSTETKRYH